ncbi:hypothetical protein KIN20_020397 [Parelaphostrongylus tenuis]|uniref:Uncharacterized protein n=1 Tax=Parelaphostrongylus tenuis TaxID=148309 RepID=A0AAD5MME0_PARTN|nr:hypothetical protein KIN20_020397 [Parelaphostrongylus tenuis]
MLGEGITHIGIPAHGCVMSYLDVFCTNRSTLSLRNINERDEDLPQRAVCSPSNEAIRQRSQQIKQKRDANAEKALLKAGLLGPHFPRAEASTS